MRGVVFIRAIKSMNGQQRRQLGQQWLYEAVAVCGHPEVTAQTYPILRTEKGKPYFVKEAGVYFSISHSKDFWACVVSDGPVGLDLQYHKQGRLDQIPGRFFHPQEAVWLEQQGDNRDHKAFFEVWAAKESYVKWTGEGIDRHFKEFSVVDETGLAARCGGAYFWRKTWQEHYSLCLCGGEPWDEVQVVWMDQET